MGVLQIIFGAVFGLVLFGLMAVVCVVWGSNILLDEDDSSD